MKILIATGIYPPQIGGPAQYAKNLAEEYVRQGNDVVVRTYRIEHKLPTGIRHLFFFFRMLFSLRKVDFVIALDTFSVGLPAVMACKIFRKKIMIRTGGDFLWESYVERTGDLVKLKDFYTTRRQKFSLKDKIIFWFTRLTLQHVDAIVWSTEWQKDIFLEVYGLQNVKHFIIQNFYGQKEASFVPEKKIFLFVSRALNLKNGERVKRAFLFTQKEDGNIMLDTEAVPYEKLLEKIKHCYAILVPSISEISPNMVLDAIRYNKPFIATAETGLYEKLKDAGLFVDPENEEDIKKKILFLAEKNNYDQMVKKVEAFTFTHSWGQITKEFVDVYNKIK